MRRRLLGSLVVLVVASVVMPGCGSLFFKSPIPIRVETNVPANVKELEDGHSGSAPGEISMSRDRDHTLEVSAPGYATQRAKVESHVSWWRTGLSVVMNGGIGLLTIWMLAIPGIIGLGVDADSGAWRYLDDPVHVTLERDSGGSTSVTSKPSSVSKRFCGSCGSSQEGNASFCPSCGAKQ